MRFDAEISIVKQFRAGDLWFTKLVYQPFYEINRMEDIKKAKCLNRNEIGENKEILK